MALLATMTVNAEQTCNENVATSKQDVTYAVNKDIPKHLIGATITVTLADGSTSSVPAEKFMIVPRKQYTVVAEQVNTTKTLTCKVAGKKNNVSIGLRKDVVGLDKSTNAIPNGIQAKVKEDKDIVPSINYYRREVIGGAVGFGVGIDKNGTPSASVGLDF